MIDTNRAPVQSILTTYPNLSGSNGMNGGSHSSALVDPGMYVAGQFAVQRSLHSEERGEATSQWRPNRKLPITNRRLCFEELRDLIALIVGGMQLG